MWVDNVVAIGNAGGFVEPLEATALMVVCSESQTLVEFLLHSNLKPTETFRNLFNKALWNTWEEIRNFLALHYYANTRMDTPYWKACREETDISGLQELLAFYRENGPTGFGRHTLPHTGTDFGMEGYLVMMVGNKVPYQNRSTPTEAEWNIWRSAQAQNRAIASQAMTVKEALYFVHHPGWQWNSDAQPLIPK
jgi:tryptophan halogenase